MKRLWRLYAFFDRLAEPTRFVALLTLSTILMALLWLPNSPLINFIGSLLIVNLILSRMYYRIVVSRETNQKQKN